MKTRSSALPSFQQSNSQVPLIFESERVEETQSRLIERRVVVNDFAFVSMPASGWMAADAQP
jgi:hypothetical protein